VIVRGAGFPTCPCRCESQAEPPSRLIRGNATPSVGMIRIQVEQQEGQNLRQKKEATDENQPGLTA